jgi:hypothetical protein
MFVPVHLLPDENIDWMRGTFEILSSYLTVSSNALNGTLTFAREAGWC